MKIGELKAPAVTLSPQLKEDKKALDIIQEAMDETLVQSGELLVLYDKFGELTLTTPKTYQSSTLSEMNPLCLALSLKVRLKIALILSA